MNQNNYLLMSLRLSVTARQLLPKLGCVVAAFVFAVGCGNGGGEAGGAAGSGGPQGKPALPTMAVAVEPAARGSIATYYSATASLDPDKRADILARVSGVVEALVSEEGDQKAKGSVLLHIEDDEYRHRVTLAEVDVDQNLLRFERSQKMVEQGLTSAESFESARRDLRSAEAALELAKLELSYTRVAAPFTGRVVRRHVDQGQTVSNGTSLFTMADMSRLLARVYVPAKEFRKIRADQPVELVVTSSGDRLTGRIDLVSPLVDPESGTIKVTVEVTEYPPTTRPGDFVEVSIVTDRHEDSLLVPRVAVVTERGRSSVFVAEADAAHQRTVEVGFQDEDSAEILSGLDAGEMIVVQGQRALRDGQPISVLDSMNLEADEDEAESPAAAEGSQSG